MGNKLRKLTLSMLLTAGAAVLLAPAADASREPHPTTTTTEPAYVPPPKYGQNPHPELPAEPDPYAGSPGVLPTIVPVNLPAVGTDPGAGLAGGGAPLDEAPSAAPTDVLGRSDTRPAVKAPSKDGGALGGVLSRTGAETLPLARAGLAALALGAGLIVLARRRRTSAASA
jgi:hypothetical protein